MECGNGLTHAVLVNTRTHTEYLQFTAFCGIHSQIDCPFIAGGDKFIFQCHLRKKKCQQHILIMRTDARCTYMYSVCL